MRLKEKIKVWWPLAALYAAVLALSMLLEPMGDDWFFLRYLPGVDGWSMNSSYNWLHDCLLLPRDYWRPIEDVMMTLEGRHPWLFPYLNHFAAVTCGFIAAAIACSLAIRRLGVGARTMVWVTTLGMIMANNMGALLSVDSITQTSATMFGIISVALFCSSLPVRWRYPLWIIAGFMACLSKETGVVCFVVGPLFKLVCTYRGQVGVSVKSMIGRGMRMVGVGLVPAVIYLGAYATLKHMAEPTEVAAATTVAAQADRPDFMENLTESQMSHRLTPATFIKNIAIEYVLGIWPVDTSAVYYPNRLLLVLTALLGMGGIVLIYRLLRGGKDRVELVGLMLIVLVASAPSMITRAGEISPFISNIYLLMLIGVLVRDATWTRAMTTMLAMWLVATLITDIHKFSLAYRGGMICRNMAIKVKQATPAGVGKVMWTGPDERHLDRAGEAFNVSPYKTFMRGAAVMREFDYKNPAEVDALVIEPGRWSEATIDSIAREATGRGYDCLWVTTGTLVRVIDLR